MSARPLPSPARRRILRGALALVAAAAGLGAAGCKTSWELESREVPVTVVLLAPAATAAAQQVPMVVYVGDRKAVDGTVQFPAGTTRVVAPPVYVRSGEPTVSVILSGRSVASSSVKVRQPTWVVVALAGGGASISSSDQDPTASR